MRCRVRAAADGPARIDVFDDIGAGGWFSEGLTAKGFADELGGVTGPLDVHINSGGGDVADGIAIMNAISNYPGRKRTVVDGLAASIASVILQAGDERIVEPGSMVMIHDPLTLTAGNAADFRKAADTLDKHGDNLASVYARRAGGTPQQWRDVMQGEQWYTADEAVDAGLADRVGSSSAALPEGLDVAALYEVPGRVMARLRSMPRAAAPDSGDGGGEGPPCPTCKGKGKIRGGNVTCPDCQGNGVEQDGDDGGAQDRGDGPRAGMAPGKCRTCKGAGRLPHPVRGEEGPPCPSCETTGTYPPPSGGQDDGAQDRARDEIGKPYEPLPYSREAWEDTQCPSCKKFSDQDGRYCGQCGLLLVGRTDVQQLPRPGGGASPGPASPGPAAPGPAAPGALTEARVREILREEVRAAAARVPVTAAGVDSSPWDASKAWAAGSASDDPEAFFKAICAGEKTTGEPDTQGHWALPYKYSPSSAVNAAAVRACLSRLDSTQDLKDPAAVKAKIHSLMRQVNPDWEPEDSNGRTIFAAGAAERFRAAMPALSGRSQV